jgi:hypothetical protein
MSSTLFTGAEAPHERPKAAAAALACTRSPAAPADGPIVWAGRIAAARRKASKTGQTDSQGLNGSVAVGGLREASGHGAAGRAGPGLGRWRPGGGLGSESEAAVALYAADHADDGGDGGAGDAQRLGALQRLGEEVLHL